MALIQNSESLRQKLLMLSIAWVKNLLYFKTFKFVKDIYMICQFLMGRNR